MELTAEVIKQYHLEQAQAETLEEKQELFLRMVRNYKDFAVLQHRKMWIWIAQQYAKGSKAELDFLKKNISWNIVMVRILGHIVFVVNIR